MQDEAVSHSLIHTCTRVRFRPGRLNWHSKTGTFQKPKVPLQTPPMHTQTCMHNNIGIYTSVSRDCSNPVDSPRCRWILRLHSEEIVQLYFLKCPPSGCTSVTQIEGRGREKKTQERFEVRMDKNNNATVKYCGV